jgi:hypothetical protein
VARRSVTTRGAGVNARYIVATISAPPLTRSVLIYSKRCVLIYPTPCVWCSVFTSVIVLRFAGMWWVRDLPAQQGESSMQGIPSPHYLMISVLPPKRCVLIYPKRCVLCSIFTSVILLSICRNVVGLSSASTTGRGRHSRYTVVPTISAPPLTRSVLICPKRCLLCSILTNVIPFSIRRTAVVRRSVTTRDAGCHAR